jgi:hypothetical protein
MEHVGHVHHLVSSLLQDLPNRDRRIERPEIAQDFAEICGRRLQLTNGASVLRRHQLKVRSRGFSLAFTDCQNRHRLACNLPRVADVFLAAAAEAT